MKYRRALYAHIEVPLQYQEFLLFLKFLLKKKKNNNQTHDNNETQTPSLYDQVTRHFVITF